MMRALGWLRHRMFEARHRFPRGLRTWAKHQPIVRRLLVQGVRWGNLRRGRPFSVLHGGDRGRPVDRVYIEDFLRANAGDIRGSVLEVQDSGYTYAFGKDQVLRSEVLDVVTSNPAATIVGDLSVPGALPRSTFDCVILTQTLQFVAEPRQAIRTIVDSLKVGGVALITVPVSAHRIIPDSGDRWRFTPQGLDTLLRQTVPEAEVRFEAGGRGNFLANAAFLYGLAEEDLEPADLAGYDPDYPLVAVARVVRIGAPPTRDR
jgi:SAM-dependent methyltransferase